MKVKGRRWFREGPDIRQTYRRVWKQRDGVGFGYEHGV